MRVSVSLSASCALLVMCALPAASRAQDSTATNKPWYDRLTFRGYAQFRYNRLLETNEQLKCSTCDRSIGENGGFFLRRARLAITGEVNHHITVSIQPDLSSEVGGKENTLVLRQYFADIYLDSARTLRARIGQSEVPTGFEALQSSSRRAPLDRSDAMESAAPGEQDLGVFFYWTSPAGKRRYRATGNPRLKGTGDYGNVALGIFNGQGGNRPEMNDSRHIIARVAYPFRVHEQWLEVEAHAFTGTYTIASGQRAAGVGGGDDFDDRRVGGSFMVFPQPIGVQAEWTVGRGPQYDAATNAIDDQALRGGYATVSYGWGGGTGAHRVLAYTRAQYFGGAFKTDPDARGSVVHEYEPGVEWTVDEGFELTAAYAMSDRHYRDSTADKHEHGRFLRLQAQVSF